MTFLRQCLFEYRHRSSAAQPRDREETTPVDDEWASCDEIDTAGFAEVDARSAALPTEEAM
jgi:hypothetical protein